MTSSEPSLNTTLEIRLFGDPVLRKMATDVTEIDGRLRKLAEEMFETMYAEPGIGLAAPQVGISERFFVYDTGEESGTLINPVVTESDETWVFEEGCLSVPGFHWDLERPKQIHVTGYDLDGNEVSLDADELFARCIQHEMDHLDGVLLVDHLEGRERKNAMKALREHFIMPEPEPKRGLLSGLRLP